jgi:hypothetical protein
MVGGGVLVLVLLVGYLANAPVGWSFESRETLETGAESSAARNGSADESQDVIEARGGWGDAAVFEPDGVPEPDAGPLSTPETLGLTPAVLAPGQVPNVPASIRHQQAVDAITRFADRIARLEHEREERMAAGETDTSRLDRGIDAARRRLSVAEFAEQAIRDELANATP